ncbi:hypothetical protein AAF712_004485 [Marasmius tenuissimus]|uniref:Mid2 domain-containing protein n=1 Tax=Marasmius tenuissimus TaxID=585030 RepID=A0ABR3A4T8_9AGAR
MILLGLRKDSQDTSTFMTGSGSWKEMDVAAGNHGSEETAVKLRAPRLLGVKKQVKIVSIIREKIRSRIADRLGIGEEDETQVSPPPVSTPPPNTPPPTTLPPSLTTARSQNSPGQGSNSPGTNDETSDSISSTKDTTNPPSTTKATSATTKGTATTRSTATLAEQTTSDVSSASTSTTDAPVTTSTERPTTPTSPGITLTFPTKSSSSSDSTSSPSSTLLPDSTPEPPRRPIAGIVAGVVLGTLALTFVVAFIVWRRRRAARAQARGLSFENISYPFTTGNTSFSSASMSYHPPLSPPSRVYMGVAGDNAPQMRQGSMDSIIDLVVHHEQYRCHRHSVEKGRSLKRVFYRGRICDQLPRAPTGS